MADREFMFIRPFCVRTLEEQSTDSVRALADAVQQVNGQSLQQLQEYIMVPLTQILTTPNRTEAVTVATLDCVCLLLSSTEICSWNMFSKTTFLVIMTISSPDKSEADPVAKVSDEIKQAVLSCLKSLLSRCAHSVREKFYSAGFLTQLGHITFLLLNVAEKDAARETRILAMECLAVVCKQNDSANLRRQAADSLATFLPGLSMGLTKVAIDGGITGHVVVVKSVELLTDLMCNVLGDDLSNPEVETVTTSGIADDGHRGVSMPVRNVEWKTSTAQKLLILVQKLASLDSHSHWRVRSALAGWAGSLLLKCKRSLEECVPVLLGVTITLSLDKYTSVAELCRGTLDSFSALLDPKERSLLDLLQENFYCTILQLPIIVHRSDDAKKLSVLNQLCGYIAIMGSSVDLILNSSSHLEKLSSCLIQMTELDCRHFHLVTELTPVTMDALQEVRIVSTSRQRRKFLRFQDENVALRLCELCRLIGKWGKFDLIVDHFVDRIHESSVYRKQAILLLNEVIMGAKERCGADPMFSAQAFQIISSICEEYMSPSIWNLKVAYNDRINDSDVSGSANDLHAVVRFKPAMTDRELSLTELNSNAIQLCLLLEGLANCSELLEDKFNPLLMKVLYNVLEKMGNYSAAVSHAAFVCLSLISRNCGYSTLPELILANADYLLNSLSIKLRYDPTDTKGPTVFRVALQHADHRVLLLAEDIVDEILTQLDTFQNEQLGIYLNVLLALVMAVCKWFPSSEVLKPKSPDLMSDTPSDLDLRSFILDYDRAKRESQNYRDDVDDSGLESASSDQSLISGSNADGSLEQDSTAEETGAQKSPIHIRMVVKVLQRCGHLLPTQSTLQAVCVLDIINNSAVALRDHENDLLPLVHKLWIPIVCRISDRNPPVLRAVLRTLCVLGKTCGEFVRQRLLKEAWPKVIEFLDMNCKSLRDQRVIHHNLDFRLLVDMLSNAGELAKSLKLPVLAADDLASVAVPYLSSRQPKEIQEAAISVISELSKIHPDLVWLKLNDLYCEDDYHAKSSNFKAIKMGGFNPHHKEFAINVRLLLRLL